MGVRGPESDGRSKFVASVSFGNRQNRSLVTSPRDAVETEQLGLKSGPIRVEPTDVASEEGIPSFYSFTTYEPGELRLYSYGFSSRDDAGRPDGDVVSFSMKVTTTVSEEGRVPSLRVVTHTQSSLDRDGRYSDPNLTIISARQANGLAR